MTLTAEQFDQITASLRSDDPGVRSSEKRECPRVGMRVQIEIISFATRGQPARYRVWLRDFSTTGIGFVYAQPIKQGSALIVCLPKGRNDTLKLLYKVVRSVQIDETQYIIGARLERSLDDTAAPAAASATAPAAPAITPAATQSAAKA